VILVKLKRPSLPLVIASLALFVALGGPAEAQRLISGNDLRTGSVSSRAVKDRGLEVRDLSRRAQRRLRATRNNSINENKLATAAVTPGKLARGAVTAAAIADHSLSATEYGAGSIGSGALADSSVIGSKVADGSLGAADLGRFWGRFRATVGPVPANTCWSGALAPPALELSRADISQDLVLVTPGADWPDKELSFSVSNDGEPHRFVITACNPANTGQVEDIEVGFRYLVIDLP
jgi:hypothetical protein